MCRYMKYKKGVLAFRKSKYAEMDFGKMHIQGGMNL